MTPALPARWIFSTVPRQEHTHSRRTPTRQPACMDTVKALTQPPVQQPMTMTDMEGSTETIPVYYLTDTTTRYPALKRSTVLHKADTVAHSAK